MQVRISPQTSFHILRSVGKRLGILSFSSNTEKGPDYFFWFALFNYVLILLPVWYGLYVNQQNITAAIFSWVEVSGFMEAAAILIYGKFQKPRLQVLFSIAENQISLPKPDIIKHYANFYSIVFIIILISYSMVMVMYMFLVKPDTKNDELLTTAIYPFKIESHALLVFLYINQVFTLTYSSIVPNFDGIAVLLIFTCTDRLKALEWNFRNARDSVQLRYCIEEHNNCLLMIKETNNLVRFIVLKTIFSFMSSVLGCGLGMLNNTELSQWLYQMSILFLVYARIYLCAESAENMSSAGKDIENAVYSTEWYDEDLTIMAVKTVIIQKCQSSPTISVSGFMTAINRKYLGFILWTTASYLMTLKAVIGQKY